MDYRVIIFIGLFVIFKNVVGYSRGNHSLWNDTMVDKLKNDLLTNYDQNTRPAHHLNTTQVYIGMHPYYISIDEFKSAVNIRAYLMMTWNDDKLRWNTSAYGGLDHLEVRHYYIWQPEIIVLNGADSSAMGGYGDPSCHVTNTGSVTWEVPAHLLVLCDLDLRLWPFDTQNCTLRIVSASHAGNQMNLSLFNYTISADVGMLENTEWRIIQTTMNRKVDVHKCCPEDPFITLFFNILVKRSSTLYKSVVMTPTVFIVFLNLIIFWLPPNSKEKLILCSFLAVIICYFLVYFMQRVPALLYHTPLIVLFYSGCLYQVTISLVIAIVVINLTRRSYCRSLPWMVKSLLMGWMGQLLGLSSLIQSIQSQRSLHEQELRESSFSESTSNELDDKESIINSPPSSTTQLEWLLLATAIDRISFLIFCGIFALMAISCLS